MMLYANHGMLVCLKNRWSWSVLLFDQDNSTCPNCAKRFEK